MLSSVLNRFTKGVMPLVASLMAISFSTAQESSLRSSGITVTVSQQTKLSANKVRLLLPVRVETRDALKVLKVLKSHEESVRKELKTFGVEDTAIEFSTPVVAAGIPGVDDPVASRKAARNQVIQMRNMNPHMKAQYPVPNLDDFDDSELPIVYSADTTLTVDWKLNTQVDEAAILLPSKIKTMYEKNDLSGTKLRVELAEDEQSLVDPLLGNSNFVSYPVQAAQNNRLFYVGELTDEQEKAAFADAIKKARKQAVLLAESSGLRLGKIRSIQTSELAEPVSAQANILIAMQSVAAATPVREKNNREVLSANLNGLRRTITLIVVFDFE